MTQARNLTSVVILGSTGSIGRQALEVIAAHPDRFRVGGLGAQRNVDLLTGQCLQFLPTHAVLASEAAASELRAHVPSNVHVMAGEEGMCELAALPDADLVLASITGMAGLKPVLAAVRAGKRVAIANKEPVVTAGEILMAEAARCGATILPVDSEHSAIFQLLEGRPRETVTQVLLTGSGGPFRNAPADLSSVTAKEALAHPTWKMGPKVTVDSATLMNKGLEVIEAHRLFDIPLDAIRVIIHPQSIIHSMVELNDGAIFAHLGYPDMRIPIQYALGFPDRLGPAWSQVDLCRVGELTFLPPDLERFPCLRLAFDAARAGGTAPTVMNAADEVAVEEFLAGRIRFTDISRIIEKSLSAHTPLPHPTIEEILAVDGETRRKLVESS